MNLGPGFASGFADALPEAELRWQRVLAGRQALQEQQRQQQAQAAFLRSLLSPGEAALPQQGPPGMMQPQQAPAAQSPQLPPSLPTGASGASVPGPVTPPSPPTPGPTAGTGGFTPPDAGGRSSAALQMPDPMMRLRVWAQQLKRNNPGMDDRTLFEALKTQVDVSKGLVPEERILMQTELAQQKFQMTRDLAEFKADMSRALKEQDIQSRERMLGVREAGLDRRQATSISAKEAAAAKASSGATLSDDEAQVLAQAWAAGDRSVTSGLGWGKAGAANRAKVMSAATKLITERGGDGNDLAAAKAAFMGDQAGLRTAGTQGARIDIAAHELKTLAPPLLAASKAVDRTKFPTWNAVQLAAQRGTGGTAVIKLVSAVNAYKQAYAQLAARGGQSTDDARRRSDEVMSAAWSNGQIEAGVQQLQIEAEAALKGTAQAGEDIAGRIKNRGKGAPADAPPGAGDTGGWSIRPVQ